MRSVLARFSSAEKLTVRFCGKIRKTFKSWKVLSFEWLMEMRNGFALLGILDFIGHRLQLRSAGWQPAKRPRHCESNLRYGQVATTRE
jgi:hypothetical protein